MSEEKDGKVNRVLTIYERLIKGEVIHKKQLSILFGVNEKTIQRDIEDIRAYLYNNPEYKSNIDVEYRRDKKGYCISKREDTILNREDVLAISKILLESRAFCKEEINHIITAVLGQIDIKQRKYVKELIGNELLNFVPLKHNERLLSKIWDLSEFIRHKEIIQISYVKIDGTEVERILKPVAIIFSEYYFYLIAYFHDFTFDNPAVFRVDRIKKYKGRGNRFSIPESERFEDGNFRKRVQFMYTGKLTKITFKFWGASLDAVLDRLPTARVVGNDEDKSIIEAEVYGERGAMMWLNGQMEFLEVIYPNRLRENMQKTIRKMLKNYD